MFTIMTSSDLAETTEVEPPHGHMNLARRTVLGQVWSRPNPASASAQGRSTWSKGQARTAPRQRPKSTAAGPMAVKLSPCAKPSKGTCAAARSPVLARSCPDFVAILACLATSLRILARMALYATTCITSPKTRPVAERIAVLRRKISVPTETAFQIREPDLLPRLDRAPFSLHRSPSWADPTSNGHGHHDVAGRVCTIDRPQLLHIAPGRAVAIDL